MFDSGFVVLFFVLYSFCNHLAEEKWAGCFTLFLAFMFVSLYSVSTWWCHGLACYLLLCHFLVIHYTCQRKLSPDTESKDFQTGSKSTIDQNLNKICRALLLPDDHLIKLSFPRSLYI